MKILIIDDDEVMRKLLCEVLVKEGYQVQLAESGEAATQLIRKECFPVVLSDIRMLELDGIGVLREVKKSGSGSSVILMTGFGSMEGAIDAIREGAFDYVSKPFKMNDLKAVVARAAKHWESSRILNAGVKVQSMSVPPKAMTGKSPKIVEVYKRLARASMSTSAVVITGENGTGRELVAHAIHRNSPRRERFFVVVSCALPEDQLERELFGTPEKAGLVEEANGGSIFLDEIAALASPTQVKLLRLLEDGEIKRGGSSETKKVDVRLLAATKQDLDSLVKQGKFREDLYYRIKGIVIEVPPLRERIEDLPELVSYFLAKYAEKNKKSVSHVSEEAMAMLRHYPWPGNVRELEHAIERAVVMTNGAVIFPEDLPQEILKCDRSRAMPIGDEDGVLANSLEEMERHHIVKVLNEVNFNKSKASEVLGIDRATLYRKAQRYGIDLRGK